MKRSRKAPAKKHPTRAIAERGLRRGDYLGWFEEVYAEAKKRKDWRRVSWADMLPNPRLSSWIGAQRLTGKGKKALVVGCGLGDDAEYLSRLGFRTLAFDISPTAIAWCKKLAPHSRVRYVVEDLLNPPRAWTHAFDLVVEIYTLRVFPEALRAKAIP